MNLLTFLKQISHLPTPFKNFIYFLLPRSYYHLRRFQKPINISSQNPPRFEQNLNFHLIGSGPSVKTGISLIENESISAFVNGSVSLFDSIPSIRTLYFCTDPDFVKTRKNVVLEAMEKCSFCFFSYEVAQEIDLKGFNEKTYLIDQYHCPFWKKRKQKNSRVGFSKKPFKCVFSGETVSFVALQFINSFKPKTVHLHGLDFSGERFYQEDKKRPSRLQKSFKDIIKPSFDLAQKEMNLLNHSPKNLLEIS